MRLLVVEDEQTLAMSLRRGLEEAGWTVDVSATAEDAWQRLLLSPYAVRRAMERNGANRPCAATMVRSSRLSSRSR